MYKILTVSVASYNVEKTLRRTIESITKAKNAIERIEVIVVNDGSKDKTLEIAKEYAELFPDSVKIIDKPNGGYGSTVNAALEVAIGKYFKLLDGDDTFETENIEDFIDFLQAHDEDIVICPYNEIYETSGEIKLIDVHKENDLSSDSQNLVMHEIAVKTKVLKKVNTKITEYCFYTDNEFVFYALMGAETFKKYELPIYNYYLGVEGQSVSIEGVKKHYKDMIKVSDKSCSLYEEYMSIDPKNTVQTFLIENKLRIIVRNVYGSFLVLDNTKDTRRELIDFDKKLKAICEKAYIITQQEKKVKVLRTSKFLLFGVLNKREKKRF